MGLQNKGKWILFVTGIVWACLISVGIFYLWQYENTPGVSREISSQWPSDTHIRRINSRPTLVMFAHPQCPCTRASIGELAKIMTRYQARLAAYVVFVQPPDFPDDLENGDIRQSAQAIPGVAVLLDKNNLEAKRFHATTSGHTFLFDPQGQLLFSGGITISRGHAGDNPGS